MNTKLILLLALSFARAFGEVPAEWILIDGINARNKGVVMQMLPVPIHCSSRPLLNAELTAREWNKAHPAEKEFVVHTSGVSMLPLYPVTGVYFVTRKIPYGDIKPGMVVTYCAQFAHRNVSHIVLCPSSLGYFVQGLNNPWRDPECMTPDNYLGVSVEAFD
jgi:hypothetical protein